MAIPRPDTSESDAAALNDLAVGVWRAWRAWILVILAIVLFFGVLMWGANQPDDPALPDHASPVEAALP